MVLMLGTLQLLPQKGFSCLCPCAAPTAGMLQSHRNGKAWEETPAQRVMVQKLSLWLQTDFKGPTQ